LAAPEEIHAAAQEFARRLSGLEEGIIRARAAGRALARLGAKRAVDILAELVGRVGDADARRAVSAVGQALLEPQGPMGYELLAEIYTAAKARGLTQVASLLLSPPPRRAWQDPFDKPDSRLAHLSLGHKKSLARLERDPDLLARLAAEGEPIVVRELLRNPQLTETFAVRIASRRPCRPETLRCLYEERRWRTRTAVMLALARNPYAETEIALKLLPILPSRQLGELARDGSLHPLVRSLAAKLWGARKTAGGGARRP
jgi:hypothetical protein